MANEEEGSRSRGVPQRCDGGISPCGGAVVERETEVVGVLRGPEFEKSPESEIDKTHDAVVEVGCGSGSIVGEPVPLSQDVRSSVGGANGGEARSCERDRANES